MQRIIPKPDTIARRIFDLVKKSNMTLEQLKEETGINESSWSSYTSGRRVPETTAIVVMCEYFECSADWLLMGKE